MRPVKIGTAFSHSFGPFISSTDGATLMSALAIGCTDIRLSKNGSAAYVSKSTATTPAYVELGYVNVTFSATDLETAGHTRAMISLTSAGGALPVWEDFWVSETSDIALTLTSGMKSVYAQSTDISTLLTNVASIQAKTTNLPSSPASSTSILAWAMSTDMATALTNITAIQAKTTNLPATPASSTSILSWAMSTDMATALTALTAIQAKTTALPASPASSTSFTGVAMTTDIPASTGIADDVWDAISETTESYGAQMRLTRAALAGKASGGGTASITYRDAADAINRLTLTATTDGNRTSVTIATS